MGVNELAAVAEMATIGMVTSSSSGASGMEEENNPSYSFASEPMKKLCRRIVSIPEC